MNLYHNVKAQWLAYASVLPIAGVASDVCQQLVSSQSVRDLWRVRHARIVDQPVLGLWRHSQSGTRNSVWPWRLRHGDDDADADAGCVKSDPAVHVEQQSRSPAAVLGTVPPYRTGYRPVAGGADAVLRDLRWIDVPRAGLRTVLRDHDTRDAERLVHADPGHPALHQRRQRHYASLSPQTRGLCPRSLQPRRPIGPCWHCCWWRPSAPN